MAVKFGAQIWGYFELKDALEDYFETGDNKIFGMLETSKTPIDDARLALWHLYFSGHSFENEDGRVVDFAKRMVQEHTNAFFTEPMSGDSFNGQSLEYFIKTSQIYKDKPQTVAWILNDNFDEILGSRTSTKSARKTGEAQIIAALKATRGNVVAAARMLM